MEEKALEKISGSLLLKASRGNFTSAVVCQLNKLGTNKRPG
jgi:hypothetical protein